MSDKPVEFINSEGIAKITLDRPAHGNSLDIEMAYSLASVAADCESDSAIRCVTLTGRGSMFCVGGDLALFSSAGDRISTLLGDLAAQLHTALISFARMKKPLIVLVNGPAAGAGLSLALVGDLVFAAKSAFFTSGYTAIGLTPDGGMSWTLPRLVGMRRAQEMILTNRRVSADEAKSIGLITRVVGDAELAGAGMELAESLANSATGALGAARGLLQESFQSTFSEHLDREARMICSPDRFSESREGFAAFLQKRNPKFPK